MKLDEGPAFGALIIGVGVGYLIWTKWHNPVWAIGAAVGLTIGDYIFLLLIKKISKK